MSNGRRHEMLDPLVHFMLRILRFHYGIILINFSDDYVGMGFHKRMLSFYELKSHNQPTFNVSLSDETNEYFQEMLRIYVSL